MTKPLPLISLEDLVGIHEIHAIWRGVISVPYSGYEETVQAVVLLLDENIVVFREGPNDSYRSSLGDVHRMSSAEWMERWNELLKTLPSLAPINPPIHASFTLSDRSSWEGDRAEILCAIDERTDLCILEIGTDNIDDYYPSFVFTWQPEGYRSARFAPNEVPS